MPNQSSRRALLGGALAATAAAALHRQAEAQGPPSTEAAYARQPKIDIHVHLGRNGQEMSAMTEDKAPGAVKFLVGEMDKHHVEKALIVAVEPVFRTEVYLEAARLEPQRLMVACSLMPRPLDQALDKLKSYHDRGAKALKLQPMQYDPRDPVVERVVYEAVRLGMPVLFHQTDLPKSFPDMLQHFATTMPDGNFVVIHFGGVYGFWDVLPLARLKNVYLETSTAFPRVVKSPLRSMLHFLVEEKGLNKLIFGSELPVEYGNVISAISELAGPGVQAGVVEAVFKKNAERILGLA